MKSSKDQRDSSMHEIEICTGRKVRRTNTGPPIFFCLPSCQLAVFAYRFLSTARLSAAPTPNTANDTMPVSSPLFVRRWRSAGAAGRS